MHQKGNGKACMYFEMPDVHHTFESTRLMRARRIDHLKKA